MSSEDATAYRLAVGIARSIGNNGSGGVIQRLHRFAHRSGHRQSFATSMTSSMRHRAGYGDAAYNSLQDVARVLVNRTDAAIRTKLSKMRRQRIADYHRKAAQMRLSGGA